MQTNTTHIPLLTIIIIITSSSVVLASFNKIHALASLLMAGSLGSGSAAAVLVEESGKGGNRALVIP